MRLKPYLLILFLLGFFFSNYTHATTFTAVHSGNWTDPDTWDLYGVPSATDDVVIDGYSVTIDDTDGDITINSITVTNASGTGHSLLYIRDAVTVTITNDLTALAENQPYDVKVATRNSSILNVNGDVSYSKTTDNVQSNDIGLRLRNDSRVNVSGNYTLNHQNSAASDGDEIEIEDNAILDIDGSVTINKSGSNGDVSIDLEDDAQMLTNLDFSAYLSGGAGINIKVDSNSVFQVSGDVSLTNASETGEAKIEVGLNSGGGLVSVGGNFNMRSASISMNSTSNKNVRLSAAGEAALIDIDGDINMSSGDDDNLFINLSSGAILKLAGNIERPKSYGMLTMDNNSTIEFDGATSQDIPADELPGSGTDSFTITNIIVTNTYGSPLRLNGDLTINTHLELTEGLILTSDTSLLIIADTATITGGRETAYISGPMVKKGRSNGASFVFPIGDENGYAPIEISAISTSTSQYQAQYFEEPPPFGTEKIGGVIDLSANEYWTLTKVAGSDDVDVTLHWTDADAQDIYGFDTLIVAGLNGSNQWDNYGNGRTTGGLGVGVSGSVSTTASEPPPFGTEKFTFAAMEFVPLPVELIDFRASEDKHQNVILSWETASEQDNMHFVIERSADGKSFEPLVTVNGSGTTTLGQFYSYVDTKPLLLAYYRLKQVDYDGSFEYSKVIYWEMNRTQKDRMAAYPTLAENEINLRFTTYSTKKSELTVVNSYGKVMLQEEVYTTDLLEYRKLDLSNYENGIYSIILSDGFKNVITKFVVYKTY